MKRNRSSAAHDKATQDMRKARKKVIRMLNRHWSSNFNPETLSVLTRKFYFFSL